MSIERADTYSKIADIVAEKLDIEKATLSEGSTFQDLGADSLDMVEIIMKLEEQFGIEVNDEDAEKLENVGQAVEYVHKLRSR